jgi:hypothetical protein
MPENNIYFSTTYVGPNNKARNIQYNFLAYTSLADEVLCKSGCVVRNLDERNDCNTECDYVLTPLNPLMRYLISVWQFVWYIARKFDQLRNHTDIKFVISGLRSEVTENCGLLENYAASGGKKLPLIAA